MQNPAAPSDLVDRGYTGPANANVQQTRLDESWRALLHEPELPGLAARIEAEDLSGLVIDVVCAATLRVLRNPEGYESESGGIDDYTESVKRADATQDIYFTAAELRRLAPQVQLSGGFTGSMKYL